MIRRGMLLLCLMMASLLTTATIHARELPNMPSLECSGIVHTDGDADQSRGDAEGAMPHHHGSCHGSTAFLPTSTDAPATHLSRSMLPVATAALAPPRWLVSPDLRPPIA